MKIILISLMAVSTFNCQKQSQQILKESQPKLEKSMETTPVYTIKISAANPYEVLVNDMPFEKEYSKGSSTIELPINDLMISSGKQIISIKLLPDAESKNVDRSGLDYFNLQVLKYTFVSSIGDDGQLIREITLKTKPNFPLLLKRRF